MSTTLFSHTTTLAVLTGLFTVENIILELSVVELHMHAVLHKLICGATSHLLLKTNLVVIASWARSKPSSIHLLDMMPIWPRISLL